MTDHNQTLAAQAATHLPIAAQVHHHINKDATFHKSEIHS
jgi:hypothetical protein